MMEEFQTRFTDFEIMKNNVALFHNPFIVVNEEHLAQLQLQLCDLQADPIFCTMKEKGMDLFKILPKETYPQLRDFGLRMSSMFGSMYLCESTFSSSSCGSSGSIVSDYRLDDRGSIPGRGRGFFL
jgi:hypothetical protein